MLYLLCPEPFCSSDREDMLTFADMKIPMMIFIGGCVLLPSSVKAQFHTVRYGHDRCKMEVVEDASGKRGSMVSVENKPDAVNEKTAAPSTPDATAAKRKEWIGRYMSVSYPLRNIKVNSPYGVRHDPFTGKKSRHNGIDLHACNDEVFAMLDGKVVKTGQDKRSGKYVVIRHGDYTVSYCHLSRILISKGASVRPGEVVGITGSTGRSTGEHLHITVRYRKKYVNPLVLLDAIHYVKNQAIQHLSIL